jgi:hypothetical protein
VDLFFDELELDLKLAFEVVQGQCERGARKVV